jgi:hypothetical protein
MSLQTVVISLLSFVAAAWSVTAGAEAGQSSAAMPPARDQIPMFLQADVYRGPNRSAQVSVALGARLPHSSAVYLRVFAAGPERRLTAEARVTAAAGVVRLTREFTLDPGEYELYAAIAESQRRGAAVAAARLPLTVVDLSLGSLAASPIVMGDAVARVPHPGTEQPFIFGATGLTPAASDRFPQSRELHVAFRVYNWSGDAGAAPDVSVEYVFYQQVGDRRRFFNKIRPQAVQMSAFTRPIDAAARAVSTGMTIPLASFPFGDFELTARITDNRSKQTITRQARFHVGS